MLKTHTYDIALSFAEEDLSIAVQIAQALKDRGVKYYLYTEHAAENLGKTLLQISLDIYGSETKHVLMLTSRVFVEKYWAGIESQIVHIASFSKPDFIFRVRLDETPVDGISKYLFSLKWQNNPDSIAETIRTRIAMTKTVESGVPISNASDTGLKTGSASPVVIQKAASSKRSVKLIITAVSVFIAIGVAAFIYFSKKPVIPILNKVNVPGGSFIMGIDSSWSIVKPPHKVKLSSFYISKTEVTVEEYRTFCNATGNAMPPPPPYRCSDKCPIVNITWYEAKAYCLWIGGRLPTEAEWEYAAGKNAHPGDRYSGANAIDKVGYYAGNARQAHEAGSKMANPLGLVDMTGNVAEWCSDWLGYYPAGDQDDPKGALNGKWKVVRGGHYESHVPSPSDTSVNRLCISYRDKEEPGARRPYIGFRVVWDEIVAVY